VLFNASIAATFKEENSSAPSLVIKDRSNLLDAITAKNPFL